MHPLTAKGALYQFMVRKPYCVSRLIQFLRGCYRFYIYSKRSEINTFQNGRCTHAWAAIVFLIRIAALSIFGSVKFNDSLFSRGAIVIFCTQHPTSYFIKNSGLFPYKKQWAEYLEIPGIRPLLSSNLRADFRPVAESKRHPSIRIHCCMIHKSVKQLLTEIH